MDKKPFFIDREVIIRSEEGATLFTLTKGLQKIAFGIALVMVTGFGLTTILYSTASQEIDQLKQTSLKTEVSYARLIAAFAQDTDRRSAESGSGAVERGLVRDNKTLRSQIYQLKSEIAHLNQATGGLTQDQDEIQAHLASAQAELQRLQARDHERQALIDEKQSQLNQSNVLIVSLRESNLQLQQERDTLANELVSTKSWNKVLAQNMDELNTAMTQIESSRETIADQQHHLQARIETLNHIISRKDEQHRQITAALNTVQVKARTTLQERDQLIDDLALLADRSEQLKHIITNQQTYHEDILLRIKQRTGKYIDSLSEQLRSAGLDIDKMLQEVNDQNTEGIGGPLMELGIGEHVQNRDEEILDMVHHAANLDTVVANLPLSHPIQNHKYWVSSSYGMRKDPFTKKPAFHNGVDFASKSGVDVLATGDGVVTRVGRRGPLGLAVEIKHRFGIHSIYGHLKSIDVKAGQKVTAGEPVGTLGNTGRSTGPHLHYTITINKKSINPMKIIKAGNNVRKIAFNS
ncbi:MAG: peptidoglycan DD-metalloendopeptidase family protein [Pseudomonadota bacterium]